jgi:hypothetical protein
MVDRDSAAMRAAEKLLAASAYDLIEQADFTLKQIRAARGTDTSPAIGEAEQHTEAAMKILHPLRG